MSGFSLHFCLKAEYESSDSIEEQNGASEVSLLEPFESNLCEDVPSSEYLTEDSPPLICTICGASLRTRIGLHRHTMWKHNIHSPSKLHVNNSIFS